ncbi:MAG TPA: formate/nitrite transporter family protein [Acidimicrobiales bacterium]|nr:formate/nitrite transporter family protein [Acidimicrobiales bacterium]
MSDELVSAFERSVDEGVQRLERPWPALIATGMVGGLDVSVGVFAFLFVLDETSSHLLASLAFGIGFLALTLAGSELFTENFLVPITAVVAGNAPWYSVLRLWAGTAAFNLIGGWIGMGLVLVGFPHLRHVALEVGRHPVSLGIGWQAFASATIAGGVITLMTWMERSTESVFGKVAAAWAMAFVLAAAPLQHAIVISIEAFAALHAGAPFGYLDWLGALAFASLGNAVGGIGLVTFLRLLQVGPEEIAEERARPKDAPREDDQPADDPPAPTGRR